MHPPGPDVVCHVLLVEGPDGLVLVDTGFGLADVAAPARRLGPVRHLLRPALDPEQTAVRQVERLGLRREDVRDVVLTHLDLDHVGGLADFPHARVHTTRAEADAAMRTPARRDRARYRPAQWEHGPHLVEHPPEGEGWRGFPAARELVPGLVLVPLPGHSRGHAAVAVDAGGHWVLHAGDAFYHHGTLDGARVPPVLRVMEAAIAQDRRRVAENHERLAELARQSHDDLLVVCAHDPTLLDAARRRQDRTA
jgi:glyoxylase-like metal-dependent hydrolase (beta-lactamase superfamily II)